MVIVDIDRGRSGKEGGSRGDKAVVATILVTIMLWVMNKIGDKGSDEVMTGCGGRQC